MQQAFPPASVQGDGELAQAIERDCASAAFHLASLFIKLGRKLQLHGGGHSERSFIAIDDVSDATMRIMESGIAGETYHISTTRIITIRNLVHMICDRLKVSFDDHVEIVGERLGKDAAYTLNSDKLRSQLGWRDRVTLEHGIDDTIAWVERWLEDLKQHPADYIHKH